MKSHDEDVRSRIEAVNRVLSTQRTLPSKLEAIAEIIERTVPNCHSVSIGLLIEGRAGTAATSGELAIEADLVQYAHHEGPCLQAAAIAQTVRVDVLSHDERFEHFAPGAIEFGVESVLSVPITYAEDVVGSLNLYALEPHAFDEGTEEHLASFATYAGELIAHSPLYVYSLDLMDHLAATARDQEIIATAIGALMARHEVDEDGAWKILRQHAVRNDRTLAAAARHHLDELDQPGRQAPATDPDDPSPPR